MEDNTGDDSKEKKHFKDPHKELILIPYSNQKMTGYGLILYKVESDCALREFVDNNCEHCKYQPGYAFYELKDKKEDVYECQEIVLWDEVYNS